MSTNADRTVIRRCAAAAFMALSMILHSRPVLIPALVLSIVAASCTGAQKTPSQPASDDAPDTARVSTIPGYGEFYRTMRLNALDRISFCFPTTDPRGESSVFGVVRDMEGRPTKITRFFFGNPDTRGEWTTMKIDYRWYASSGTLVERRTWHAPGDVPMQVRGAFGVELLWKNNLLTMRRLIDKESQPVGDVRMVVRSFYKERKPGVIVQEWFYGNGKQHYGVATDDPMHPFGALPSDAYFRRFWISEQGELLREEAWGITMQPIPYPGGELGRHYELNDCGQPLRINYVDATGRPATNSDGITYEALEYDDHGRVVKWQAFGPDGSPHARSSDGAAAEVYSFRRFDGVLLSIERYDARGELMERLMPSTEPESTPGGASDEELEP